MPFTIKAKYLEDTKRITLEQPPTYTELISIIKNFFTTLPDKFCIHYFDDEQDTVAIASESELTEAVRVSGKENVLRLNITGKPHSAIKLLTLVVEKSDHSMENGKATRSVPSLAEMLEDPQVLQNWLEGLSNPNESSELELVSLFQNMGLGSKGSNTSGVEHQQLQQLMQVLLANPIVQQLLPQLMNNIPQSVISSILSGNSKTDESNQNEDNTLVHSGFRCNKCGTVIRGTRYSCTSCPDFDICSKCESKPDVHDPTHVLLKIRRPQEEPGGRGCPYNKNDYVSPRHNNMRRPSSSLDSAGEPILEFEGKGLDIDGKPITEVPSDPMLPSAGVQQLLDMGFTNFSSEGLQLLLTEHKGDVARVVQILLGM